MNSQIIIILKNTYKNLWYNLKKRGLFNGIYKLMLILIAIVCIILNMLILKTSYANMISKNIYITAHRGSSLYYPENTILSIEQAINENADYVEIDVRVTKDNKVVLFHDSSLKRIDGTNRKIKDMTLEEVKAVDNGSYKNEKYKDEKIPTLEEVFQKFRGKTKFNIELKDRDEYDILSKEVARLINQYFINSDVAVSCFDKNIIQQYKIDNPQTKTGYITSCEIENISNISSDFISIKYDLLTKELVDEIHNNDKEVHVWTLNDKVKIIKAIDLDVDNIITNNVNLVQEMYNILECISSSNRQ